MFFKAFIPALIFQHKLFSRFIRSKTNGTPHERIIAFYWNGLAIELQLLCISFMTVETLIRSYSVSSSWRDLLSIAEIHPIRRPTRDRKSNLYFRKNLQQNFDRRAYLDAFRHQALNARIPEEFQFWVLEWPETLIINNIWPGLPPTLCILDTLATGGSSRKYGENLLGVKPPIISRAATIERAIDRRSGEWGTRRVMGLQVWGTMWLSIVFRGIETRCLEYSGGEISKPRLANDLPPIQIG
ncbi:hypothetical protein CVT26_007761 [Gymnopilus dilepis]|uniref:F-box domain-containing protein n=1 Tax=Gymnopilus dilepis TaxID=231916 RepID=A0A409WIP5_9AGAR|nr:hypothetical protein CVT26_007761 [Gymnopilus dilepis]